MEESKEHSFKPGSLGFDESGNMRVPRDEKSIYGKDEEKGMQNTVPENEDKKM